jgi:hypothetical protein
VYTIISILKHYYDENDLIDHYQDSNFQNLLKIIRLGTNSSKSAITCILPAYLNHKELIKLDHAKLETVLINKSTNCGYYMNRNALIELLQLDPNVIEYKFDKNRYPGVITTYKVNSTTGANTTNTTNTTNTKNIKIIFFNTGKINITATKTHEQVNIAYQFIKKFCADNFKQLLLVTEYQNKMREYDEKLPNQYYVGQRGAEAHHYYLLKASSIISNPRNVRYLQTCGLLNCYNSTVTQ